ncbi:MAG: hypothetical protein K6C10_07860 [Prevotella sp.]|nr:hypothetical protein [Prevotella sp.]
MDVIVVSDTNVFIDLISVGLQEQFFLLPMEVHTTDMVVFEVRREGQSKIMTDLIDKGCLKVKAYTQEEMLPFFQAEHRRYNLSPADYSVLTYSKNNGYILLTGDKKLRKVVLSENVEVHGSIYVIAQMVEHHIISELQGVKKLEMLRSNNQRLPKAQLDVLIKKWRGSL